MPLAFGIAITSCFYALIAMTYRPPAYAIIDPIGATLYLLFYPATIAAGCTLVYSLCKIFDTQKQSFAFLLCILSSPMPAFAVYRTTSSINQQNSASWPDLGLVLGDHLLDYHSRNPDAFEYISSDEEVSVTGFAEYLRSLGDSAVPSGWTTKINTRKDQVLDSWGNPIRYALDRNHDGYLNFAGRHENTSGVAPPTLDYSVSIAVFLSKPDNGNIHPICRRR